MKTIKKIGSGNCGYENYDIGVDQQGLCYIKFPHCSWELAS